MIVAANKKIAAKAAPTIKKIGRSLSSGDVKVIA
jgi:hypothetical protein